MAERTGACEATQRTLLHPSTPCSNNDGTDLSGGSRNDNSATSDHAAQLPRAGDFPVGDAAS
jgi:hypothetical protein